MQNQLFGSKMWAKTKYELNMYNQPSTNVSSL